MPPTPDEIRSQLERLLASDAFAHTDRLRRFLRFVVERALAGEADALKEYVIGLEVYDRGDDYDPRVDSIVRVEAGRLRSKVESYYAHDGRRDPILIAIPRGSYAPVFERREDQRAPAESAAPADAASEPRPVSRRAWRPAAGVVAAALAIVAVAAWRAGVWTTTGPSSPPVSIAVLPFAHYTTSEDDRLLAARLTDGVTSELARLGTLAVVSHTSALRFAASGRPLREAAEALGADVVMEASVFHDDGRVRVEARLVGVAADRKFWVNDFTGDAGKLAELERNVAEAVERAIRTSQFSTAGMISSSTIS